MNPRSFLAVALMGAFASCQPAAEARPDVAGVFDGTAGRWVDLTHSLSEDAIFWPTAESFELDTVAYGRTELGYFYAAFNFSQAEHGGTHLDAPIHFAEGRQTADQIPLDHLIGPAAVVTANEGGDADYLVTADDLRAWEGTHGPLPQGAIVLLDTGWADRWPDRARYLGTETVGPAAVPELHFPGLDPGAARWLVAEREVAAVGIDTPSIDYGQSADFQSHQILYEANIPGFENVAGLDGLPASGAYVVALPAKIEGGSGGPLRIVAFIPG